MDRRTVVITGASSGIGAALAVALARHGDNVVIAARRLDKLGEVAKKAGGKTFPVVTDVTRREDLLRLKAAAIQMFGSIDVWVNNAGRGTGMKVLELTDKEIDDVLSVVLKSVVYGTQAILPYFIGRGRGHLINVSSAMGRVPFVTYRSIYSAGKAGVNILTANARADAKVVPGVKVSLVLPGIVDTEFHVIAGTPRRMKAGERVGGTMVLSPEAVADEIVSLIDNPVPELYIPKSLQEVAGRYYSDVGKFEESMAGDRGGG